MHWALVQENTVGGLRSSEVLVHEDLRICGLFCGTFIGLFSGMDWALLRKDTVGGLGSSEVLVH